MSLAAPPVRGYSASGSQTDPREPRQIPTASASGRASVRALLRADQAHVLATYLIPAIFVVVIVLGWFHSGAQIGNGDVSPLIRESANTEIGSLWNHQVTGAGGTSVSVATNIEALLLRLFAGNAEAAQRMLFAGTLVLATVGAVHAARQVVRSSVAAGVAGLLAVFNPFLLLQLPNLIFPMAIGVLGLLQGELINHARTKRGHPIRLALLSLPLAFLSTNPPLVVMLLGSILVCLLAICYVYGTTAGRSVLVFCLRSAPLLILLHSWWIVPSMQVYIGGAVGVEFAAETDTGTWSWVFAKNSLDRVVTLTAHWGWDERSFFPWVPTLENGAWWLLRWTLPAGALVGLVLASRGSQHKRRGAVVLGVATTLLIIFSQGIHAPFGPINQFLFDTVPGWWLFREPVSKFGPTLVLMYVVLFAVFIDSLIGRISRTRSLVDVGGSVACLTLAAGALLFPLPMYSGAVIPDDRHNLPSSHVVVPEEWTTIGDAVSQSALYGKVLVLPLNQYYQVTTSWGYHGVDLAPQFFDRPVVQLLPGGYFGEVAGYEQLVHVVEDGLVQGDLPAVVAATRSLGVSHIVIRRDVVPGVLSIDYADSDTLVRSVHGLQGATAIHDGEVAYVVELEDSPGFIRLQESVLVSDQSLTSVVTETGQPAINHSEDTDSTLATGITWSAEHTNDQLSAELPKDSDYAVRLTTGSEFLARAESYDVEGEPVLRLESTVRILIDGSPIILDPLAELPLGEGEVVDLYVDGQEVPLDGTFLVRPGSAVEAHGMARFGTLGTKGELGDCNNSDGRSLADAGISVELSATSIELQAATHTGCYARTVPPLTRSGEIRIPFEVEYGALASACLWSEAKLSCISSDAATSTTGELVLHQPAEVDGLQLYVYADANTTSTGIEYGRGEQWVSVVLATSEIESSTETAIRLESGAHEFASERPSRPSLLRPFGELGDCDRSDDRTFEEAGIEVSTNSGIMELQAAAHSACVSASIDAVAGDTIVVSFEHRTLGGRSARYCVWLTGPNVCAQGQTIRSSQDWSEVQLVIPITASTTAADLFFYADGPDDGSMTTRNQFRFIDVAWANAERIVVTPVIHDDDRRTPAEVSAVQDSAAQWQVSIRESSANTDVFTNEHRGRLLVLAESFAPGWELSGLPRYWSAEPVRVDDWAQGWWLDGSGDADLKLVYGPGRLTSAANVISMLTLAILCCVGLLSRQIRARALSDKSSRLS